MFLKCLIYCSVLHMTLSVAVPQHYQSYYNKQDKPSSEAEIINQYSVPVYKNIPEDHNPIQYEFTYSGNDDHSKAIKYQSEPVKDQNMDKRHYNMPDLREYKQYIEYGTDDKMEYQTSLVHHNQEDFSGLKDVPVHKYFAPISTYTNEDHSKQYSASTPVAYRREESVVPSVVYHHQAAMNHQKQPEANYNYEEAVHQKTNVNQHSPSYNNYNHDESSNSHNSFPSGSSIYYHDVPVGHEGAPSNEESKYILVNSEKEASPEIDAPMEYSHEEPKTIKYSSAHTSSHVSFNGPNASYHY